MSQEEGLLHCVPSKLDTLLLYNNLIKANQNIFGVQYMCIYGFVVVVGDFTVGRATRHRTPHKKFVAT